MPRSSTAPLDQRPSLQEAVRRAASAGQRLLADRLDLALLEAKETASRTAAGFGLGAAGGLLVLGGWVAEMAALVIFLTAFIPVEAALGSVAGGHLVLAGIGLLALRAGSSSSEEGDAHAST